MSVNRPYKSTDMFATAGDKVQGWVNSVSKGLWGQASKAACYSGRHNKDRRGRGRSHWPRSYSSRACGDSRRARNIAAKRDVRRADERGTWILHGNGCTPSCHRPLKWLCSHGFSVTRKPSREGRGKSKFGFTVAIRAERFRDSFIAGSAERKEIARDRADRRAAVRQTTSPREATAYNCGGCGGESGNRVGCQPDRHRAATAKS